MALELCYSWLFAAWSSSCSVLVFDTQVYVAVELLVFGFWPRLPVGHRASYVDDSDKDTLLHVFTYRWDCLLECAPVD